MDKQTAEALIEKHGSARAAERATGTHHTTIMRAINGRAESRPAKKAAPQTTQKPEQHRAGRALAEFREAYDKATIIPARIRAALKTLGAGWEYETEFAKLANVSLIDLGRFRDQFSEHVVSVNRASKRAWAGTTATAKAMRDML